MVALLSNAYRMFGKGNSKLGNALTFSIPAILTCPGSTALCRKLCYAGLGYFRMAGTKRRYRDNFALTKRKDFATRAIEILSKNSVGSIIRWHVSGDLYSVKYARKLLRIVRACRNLTFWVYTRSWRKPVFEGVLTELAAEPNMKLWYSCDRETGQPAALPPGVRIAYMMVDDQDVAPYKVDLVFRDSKLRPSVMKHVNGALVCPVENGVSHDVKCSKCRVCFRDKPVPTFPNDKPVARRVALQMV